MAGERGSTLVGWNRAGVAAASRAREIRCFGLAALLVVLAWTFPATAARAAASPLAPLIAQSLLDPAPLVVDGAKLDATVLRALYDGRGSEPLWVESPHAGERIAAVLGALRQVDREGLEPKAYWVDQIEALRGAGDPLQLAYLDMLISDAVMRYGVHVRTGARRPRLTIPSLDPAVDDPDPVPIALAAASAPDVAAYLGQLPPESPQYRALRDTLAWYRALDARGGWPSLPDGPKLTPGTTDPAIPLLRERLRTTGDLADATPAPGTPRDLYDRQLELAVRAFQARHGLLVDGIVGRRTRAALNTSASERVQQLIANLERLRWLPADLGERHLRVNIPDYSLELSENGTTTLAMPVIVGRTSWPTPSFSSEIRDVVFNPPWYIPPSIAKEELFPRALVDEDYFASQGISIRIRPTSSGSGSVRRLKQAPGPRNPLGRVKFNLPNPYGVYLHDTPNKDRFRLGVRSLSHGCVRVGNARELAAALLEDMPEWGPGRRASAFSSWSTRSVKLKTPIPVHLVYATAWQDPTGRVEFREDIYGNDRRLVREIARPRALRLPPSPPVLVAKETVAAPEVIAPAR